MIIRLILIVCFLANAAVTLASNIPDKTLIIGSEVDFPPFAIGRTDETAGGFSVDLWKEVAKETGLKYAIRVRPWGQILQEFKEGKIDILINIAQSEERHKYTQFSVPIVTVNGAIFVRKNESRIHSEADLAGKSIIVFKSDLAHEYAAARGWQNQLVLVDNATDGLKLLASGKHDAMLLSKLSGMQTLRELGIKNVKALKEKAGYSQKFSFGVHEGDRDLLARLNEGLAVTKASGAYDALYQKWFGIYEEKKPSFRDMLPYLASILAIVLLIGSYNFRTRRIERKKSEIDLRESEKRFRHAIEEAPFPIMIHAEDGAVLTISRTWTELSGYTLADIPTIDLWTEKAYGVHKDPVIEEIETLYNLEHRKANGEYTITCRDGSKLTWDFSSVSLGCLPDGRRTAMSMAFDVTERKHGEDELRKARATLQAAMDCSTAGIAIADAPNGKLRYVNDAGLLLRGSDRQTVVNGVGLDQYVASWQLLDLDGRQLRTDEVPLARAILYGETCSREFIIRRASDDDRIVSANASPIRDEAGEVAAGIVVFTDITEQKRAEEELKNLSRRLQLATSSAHLGVWDWNVRDNQMIWNDRMFELYGITPETFPNNIDAWMNGLHPEDKDAAIAACNAALNGERKFDATFRVLHPDNTVKYIKADALIIRGANGTAERMIGINTDITATKESELERAKLESQLHQAQKMESVGRLAGGVAHDFNNMLSVILGHAYLTLEETDISHPFRNSLDEIRKAAERSADLTRQLLAFARKQTIAPKLLDLNDTVSGMLNMLQRLIGENMHLVWQPAPNLWPLKLDPSQIDQILANLCVNARDAIADVGKITIETDNRVFDEDYCSNNAGFVTGEFVRLAVSDDGCGMAREMLDQIFEPFFTTKKVGEGTGLGLATVYGIVKQNNGFIKVYSEPGMGTTFSLYLPRHVSETAQMHIKKADPPLLGGQETILLVEDEQAILNVTSMILTKQGYTVLAANTPGEAMQLANAHSSEIHLLMTDVVMPGMNGRDLAHKLQELFPQLGVLFMSGYTANVIAHHGVLDEGVHFIQKPFSLADLATKVREVLDNK